MISGEALNHWNSLKRGSLPAHPKTILKLTTGKPPSSKNFEIKKELKKPVRTLHQRSQAMSGGDVGNFFDGIFQMVAGIFEAIWKVLDAIVQTVLNIIDAVVKVIGWALGRVSWDDVKKSVQKAVQGIANVIVLMNPIRIVANLLDSNPLTRHMFRELDKFLGGMITNAVNVSDLVFRAARGDAISKEELLKDLMFIIQVAAVVIGGPAAAGALVGSFVGREVCKHQTEAKDACKTAFAIVGAAVGGYVSAETGITWGPDVTSAASSSTSATASAGQAGAQIAERGFTDYLSESAMTYLEQRLVQDASREAIRLCQRQSWLGDKECSILGHIASNYINAPEEIDWPTFLSQEAARLGVSLLMEEWFPPQTPEGQAIRREIRHEIVEIPGQHLVYNLESAPKANPLTFLLLAGSAAFLMFGVA